MGVWPSPLSGGRWLLSGVGGRSGGPQAGEGQSHPWGHSGSCGGDVATAPALQSPEDPGPGGGPAGARTAPCQIPHLRPRLRLTVPPHAPGWLSLVLGHSWPTRALPSSTRSRSTSGQRRASSWSPEPPVVPRAVASPAPAWRGAHHFFLITHQASCQMVPSSDVTGDVARICHRC